MERIGVTDEGEERDGVGGGEKGREYVQYFFQARAGMGDFKFESFSPKQLSLILN